MESHSGRGAQQRLQGVEHRASTPSSFTEERYLGKQKGPAVVMLDLGYRPVGRWEFCTAHLALAFLPQRAGTAPPKCSLSPWVDTTPAATAPSLQSQDGHGVPWTWKPHLQSNLTHKECHHVQGRSRSLQRA